MEVENDTGIAGILNRLEKERILSYGFGSKENESTGNVWKNGDDWRQGISMGKLHILINQHKHYLFIYFVCFLKILHIRVEHLDILNHFITCLSKLQLI